MCDCEGCTTGTIGQPNPNRHSFVKTSGFLHPYIYRYTARVHRDRFLAFEGEGMTWMRQPSWQGITLFSARIGILAKHRPPQLPSNQQPIEPISHPPETSDFG